jgi:hypothetical protein
MTLVSAKVLYRAGQSPFASRAINSFGKAVNACYRRGVYYRAKMLKDRSLTAVFSESDPVKKEILLKQAIPDIWATGLSRSISTILVSKNANEILKAFARIASFDRKRIAQAANRYLKKEESVKKDDKSGPLKGWEESDIIRIAARHIAKVGEYQKALDVARTIDNLFIKVFAITDITVAMDDAPRAGRPRIEPHELDSLLKEASKYAEKITNDILRKVALDEIENKRIYFGLETLEA